MDFTLHLVCMVHTNEKGRVATISEVSATPRAQIKQDASAKYRLKYLRPECHLPPTLHKLTTFSSQLSSMFWYLYWVKELPALSSSVGSHSWKDLCPYISDVLGLRCGGYEKASFISIEQTTCNRWTRVLPCITRKTKNSQTRKVPKASAKL